MSRRMRWSCRHAYVLLSAELCKSRQSGYLLRTHAAIGAHNDTNVRQSPAP